MILRSLKKGDTIQFPDGRSVQIQDCQGKVRVLIDHQGDHVRIAKSSETVNNTEGEKTQ